MVGLCGRPGARVSVDRTPERLHLVVQGRDLSGALRRLMLEVSLDVPDGGAQGDGGHDGSEAEGNSNDEHAQPPDESVWRGSVLSSVVLVARVEGVGQHRC